MHTLDKRVRGAAIKGLFDKSLVVAAYSGHVYGLPFRDILYEVLAKYFLTQSDQITTLSRFNAIDIVIA